MKPPGVSNSEAREIKYLRLSITDSCDMRCGYCVPHRTSIAHVADPLSSEEIALLVNAFAKNGVTKVRFTGGEPLQRPDVTGIISSIVGIPGIETVGLTTNGRYLKKLAANLAGAGMRRVNISLDSLDRKTFRLITGCDALNDVLDAIDAALGVFEKVKINTVVMRGINDREIPAIASLAMSLPVEVRFIELMPLGHSASEWDMMFVSASEIRRALGNIEPLPYSGDSSARMYSLNGGRSRVGIISPMSEDFCYGCDRIRVTSSGKLRPCLRLPVEEDIRPLLRDTELPARLGEMIGRLSHHKLPQASLESAVQAEAMCSVGG
ncbi:MAG: GTP 3',8-cyclase MoaA [Armatimonadota bacterium]|nr:GTP 3',8-cyclase MoaA [Armatimonadota bacterium]